MLTNRSQPKKPIAGLGRLALPAALLWAGATSFAFSAEGPWSATWTMDLQGEERTYVDHAEASYLVIRDSDYADPLFLNRKDVVISAKYAGGNEGPRFYNLNNVRISGNLSALTAAGSGDNLYLLGQITEHAEGGYHLAVAAILEAPSDAELIAERLAPLAAEDYAGRIAVAEWVRGQASEQGNTAFWIEAALDIVRTTALQAADSAEQNNDGTLLLQAMGWASGPAGDRSLAADIGSAEWIHESQIADAVSTRMEEMGLVFHDIQGDEVRGWMPKSEHLIRRFEAVYASTDWRDAEAFYELGQETDELVDVLPRARELSHRAYQSGLRADPNHNGIRRALGLEASSGPQATSRRSETRYIDPPTGILIPGPDGWERDDAVGGTTGTAAWIDPLSDTAVIAARVINRDVSGNTRQGAWDVLVGDVRLRTGFTAGEEAQEVINGFQVSRLDYQYAEADYQRSGHLVLLYSETSGLAVGLNASYVGDEMAATLEALSAMVPNVGIPSQAPVTGPADSGDEEFEDADEIDADEDGIEVDDEFPSDENDDGANPIDEGP